jgi:hypothetical protein
MQPLLSSNENVGVETNDPVVAVKPIVFLFKGIRHCPLGAGLLLQFSILILQVYILLRAKKENGGCWDFQLREEFDRDAFKEQRL